MSDASWPSGDDGVDAEQMLVLAIEDLTASGTRSKSEVYAALEARVRRAKDNADTLDAERLRAALA